MSNTSILLLTLACFYLAQTTPPLGSQRNLWQFKTMINHKGYSVFDYNGYGCACGYSSHGPRSVDGTDQCCQVHDACYDRFDTGLFNCSTKVFVYDWKELPDGEIQCTDEIRTCNRNICECDKTAADCFAKHRSTYDSIRLSMSKKDTDASCNF